jgi:F-type H+-transporting ATPase subunit delta
MAIRLSRRKIASYYAQSLIDGIDAKKLTLQLAAYLIESRRTKELVSIISDIEYQLSLSGVVLANITSSHELSDLAKAAVTDLVKQTTGATDIQLQERIDPSVFGGVKLEFTGFELDTTIARRLTALKTNYKK